MEIKISNEVALVLFEYLARFQETNDLHFQHPAEYLALQEVAAQLEKELVVPFQEDYASQLSQARNFLTQGYEGEIPFFEMV